MERSTHALIASAGLTTVASLIAAYIWTMKKTNNNRKSTAIVSVLNDASVGPKIQKMISSQINKLTDEALIKITRQLQFWYEEKLSEEELLDVASDLLDTATILQVDDNFKVPTRRFGKTEIQIPVVTCGSMRFQRTWMPDFIPGLAPHKGTTLKHDSQAGLMDMLRICFKMGIVHFETARFYGSSEMQLSEALWTLMQNGEIKREDFILQTKVPPFKSRKEFESMFQKSNKYFQERFGYIDLFAFHCVSKKEQVEWLLSDEDDMPMAAALQYQKEGIIKHIGFSTHGTAGNIMKLINSEKFAYVNLHAHYFGSYHGEGTADGLGGHGNVAVVQRAKELDMGVFQISPLDKGGRLYHPSKTIARLIGPKMSPITFGLLSCWKTLQFDTATVGFARVADFEETLKAARIFAAGEYEADLKAAQDRIEKNREEKLGKEWVEKGLLNLPNCEEECSHGTGIGHILWCYNLFKAFGMYDFCSTRYKNLDSVSKKWNKKKSFEENRVSASNGGNPPRGYDDTVDYTDALAKHYDPKAALTKMKEVHALLGNDANNAIDRKALNCEAAYDLRAWEAYPGEDPQPMGVVLQQMTFGKLGVSGGPTKSFKTDAVALRAHLGKAC